MITAPAVSPRKGLSNIVSNSLNCGTSLSGFMACDMVSIPVINMAKPIKIVPASRFRPFLTNKTKITPTIAITGANEVGLASRRKKLLLSIPVRLNSQEVMVVPILAPMITPIAWESFMIPEFTNPTTITVVADDDWMTAVTPAPRSTAPSLLLVRFSNTLSSLPPESFSNPSLSRCIPYRNSARPPKSEIRLKILICSS